MFWFGKFIIHQKENAMKNIMITLGAILVFGIASAQNNAVESSTATAPSPGTPPIEKSTDAQIKQQGRNGAPTSLITAPPVYTTPSTSTTVTPQQPLAPVNPISNPNSYPGGTMVYPTAQGNIQPGTGTSTTQPVNGTNNPTTTLPASTTSNQGKLP